MEESVNMQGMDESIRDVLQSGEILETLNSNNLKDGETVMMKYFDPEEKKKKEEDRQGVVALLSHKNGNVQLCIYNEKELLGFGGRGCVYTSYSTTIENNQNLEGNKFQIDACKEMTDVDKKKDVLREVTVANLYYGDNQACAFITKDNGYFIKMPLIEGKTLEELCQEQKFIESNQSEKIDLLINIAKELQTFHSKTELQTSHSKIGYVHGDLNPGNIIINNGKIRFVDFGESRDNPNHVKVDLNFPDSSLLATAKRYLVKGDAQILSSAIDAVADQCDTEEVLNIDDVIDHLRAFKNVAELAEFNEKSGNKYPIVKSAVQEYCYEADKAYQLILDKEPELCKQFEQVKAGKKIEPGAGKEFWQKKVSREEQSRSPSPESWEGKVSSEKQNPQKSRSPSPPK